MLLCQWKPSYFSVLLSSLLTSPEHKQQIMAISEISHQVSELDQMSQYSISYVFFYIYINCSFYHGDDSCGKER